MAVYQASCPENKTASGYRYTLPDLALSVAKLVFIAFLSAFYCPVIRKLPLRIFEVLCESLKYQRLGVLAQDAHGHTGGGWLFFCAAGPGV